jgi:hypothetical protein
MKWMKIRDWLDGRISSHDGFADIATNTMEKQVATDQANRLNELFCSLVIF